MNDFKMNSNFIGYTFKNLDERQSLSTALENL